MIDFRWANLLHFFEPLVRVVVIGPHPVFPGSLSSGPAELCVPMWFRPQLSSACASSFVVPRQKAINRIEPLLKDLRAVASSHANLMFGGAF